MEKVDSKPEPDTKPKRFIKKKEPQEPRRVHAPYAELLMTRPLGFFSLYHQISKEDKDVVLSDALVQKLKERNANLEKAIEVKDQDITNLSKEIKSLMRNEKQRLDRITALEQEL